MIKPPSSLSITDDAISNLHALKSELQQHLGPHPVPQSDPRTKGLLFEIVGGDISSLPSSFRALKRAIAPFIDQDTANYILAVNETPPSPYHDFAMRPHIDKRWSDGKFHDDIPQWTQVMFLHFDKQAQGGELLIFSPEQADDLGQLPREEVRSLINSFKPTVIIPRPSRVCRFAGEFPHAVLGYQAPEEAVWRMSIVLAKF